MVNTDKEAKEYFESRMKDLKVLYKYRNGELEAKECIEQLGEDPNNFSTDDEMEEFLTEYIDTLPLELSINDGFRVLLGFGGPTDFIKTDLMGNYGKYVFVWGTTYFERELSGDEIDIINTLYLNDWMELNKGRTLEEILKL
jgi:hypothetical protein